MTKRVDVETLEQWKPKANPLHLRSQEQIDQLEVLYQCFAHIADNPQASQRLLMLRDSETPWATCLQVLRAEFPAAPKVAVVPPTV